MSLIVQFVDLCKLKHLYMFISASKKKEAISPVELMYRQTSESGTDFVTLFIVSWGGRSFNHAPLHTSTDGII